MRKLKLILAIAVVFFGQITTQKAVAAPEEAGDILKGIVIDAETQEPLIGAAIMVSNTTEGVITDLDGSFIINLLRDNTPFEVSYIGYKTVPFSIVTAGGSMKLDVNPEHAGNISLMLPDGEMLQNAVVTGRKSLESLQALQNERITSGFAIENMGAREMSLKGISNAQESVAKLSGISIASAGQLIVRGLGDRYSTTTLNGLPIASPNPDNKLIPLDIFPASTIQNITVSKVYEASSYADYSGAHVDISTKEGSENFFTVGFSSGGYFGTVFQDFGRMEELAGCRIIMPLPAADYGAISKASSDALWLERHMKARIVDLADPRTRLEYMMHRTAFDNSDIIDSFITEMKRSLGDKDIRKCMEAAMSYYDAGMSVTRAAEELGIHKNTLQSRVKRVIEAAGIEDYPLPEKLYLMRLIYIRLFVSPKTSSSLDILG